MPAYVRTDVQVIAAGGNYDLIPPAGYEFEVTDFGSSVWVGVAPAAVPQLDIGIFDGAIGPAFVLQSTDTRGWNRKQRLFINTANYLRITNPGGAPANASFTARVVRYFGSGATRLTTQLAAVAAGANWDIQPATGFEYVIYDIGASLWVGGAPNNLPDVTVSLFDGVNAAAILQGANARGWDKPLEIHINNATYLRLTNTNVAQNILAVVGAVSRMFGSAATVVVSAVQVIAAGGNWDVQPAAGLEHKITEVGASVWVGVAPAALPDIDVQIFDGANASILMQATDNKGWNNEIELLTHNTDYLRITDTGGAGLNACISAVLTGQY